MNAEAVRVIVEDTVRTALAGARPQGQTDSFFRWATLAAPFISAAAAYAIAQANAQRRLKHEAFQRIQSKANDAIATLRSILTEVSAVAARTYTAKRLTTPEDGTYRLAQPPGVERSRHAEVDMVFRLSEPQTSSMSALFSALQENRKELDREYSLSSPFFPKLDGAERAVAGELTGFSSRGLSLLVFLQPRSRRRISDPTYDEPGELDRKLQELENLGQELDRWLTELSYHLRRRAIGRPRNPVPVKETSNPDMRILTEQGFRTARELGVYRGGTTDAAPDP